MLKTTSKMQPFILLLGFSPFTILPVFHWLNPLAGLSHHQIFQVDWLPVSSQHAAGVCLECGQLPWLLLSAFTCVLFSKPFSLPAHTSGLPISSPENWTLSPVLEPAARLCERVQPLNPINSFLGRPRRERQLQPGPGWVGKWKRVLRKRKSVTLAAEVGMCILEKAQILLSPHLYHFMV